MSRWADHDARTLLSKRRVPTDASNPTSLQLRNLACSYGNPMDSISRYPPEYECTIRQKWDIDVVALVLSDALNCGHWSKINCTRMSRCRVRLGACTSILRCFYFGVLHASIHVISCGVSVST